MREYHRAFARKAGRGVAGAAELDRQMAEASSKVERLVATVRDGGSDLTEIRAALGAASAERNRPRGKQAQVEAAPAIALHPRIA